jgi:hypothetical protein
MTHDELLDYLREHEEYWTSLRAQRWAKVPAFNALRAVVELHKPYNDGNKLICQACALLIDPWGENCYPCPTIQAIEKELG